MPTVSAMFFWIRKRWSALTEQIMILSILFGS